SMSYGMVRDHVLGLSVVTGDGRVLRLGGKVVKNVAGFDLVKLLVGSRGTLGVITSATLRVFPRPDVDRVLQARATDARALLLAGRAVATGPVMAASVVLSGEGGGEAALSVRLHGSGATVDADERTVRRVVAGAFGGEVVIHPGSTLQARTDGGGASGGMPRTRARVYALPTRAREILDLIGSVAAGGVSWVVDLQRGEWHVSMTPDEQVFSAMARGAARLGASVSVEGTSRTHGPIEDRIRRVFDPRGLFGRGGEDVQT
ncbi:MAG: hypothetical protein OEZ37_06295, partial [Gemmatimonadota bacterium]|nr:hypothetical protein [Gemmatimonadota bacterium]